MRSTLIVALAVVLALTLASSTRAARAHHPIRHWRLWLCIHSGYLHGRRVSTGEGSWRDGGAPYYGGLQMSLGWAGIVYRADWLSPRRQMRAAELGYVRSGHSIAWLTGQWPNTAPPCLSLA